MGRSTRVLLACGIAAAVLPLSAQTGPAPEMLRTDPQLLALACAPTLVYEKPITPMHVTGGQSTLKRVSHAPGDLVTINAGTANGIEIGQEYYVRRLQQDKGTSTSRKTPAVVRTVGWLKIWAVDRPDMALATVTHACETIDIGDYLEPFSLPQMPAISREPLKPEKDNYGRIMVGTDRRRAFAKGDFFVLDRGSSQGVTPGARFVVFRDRNQYQNFLFDLGEAVAVDVKENSATLQVTLSRDAMFVGDYVAQRK
ncbi:MAG: hypothetical protein ABL986_16060 [Vicinamibacterales bacterium]